MLPSFLPRPPLSATDTAASSSDGRKGVCCVCVWEKARPNLLWPAWLAGCRRLSFRPFCFVAGGSRQQVVCESGWCGATEQATRTGQPLRSDDDDDGASPLINPLRLAASGRKPENLTQGQQHRGRLESKNSPHLPCRSLTSPHVVCVVCVAYTSPPPSLCVWFLSRLPQNTPTTHDLRRTPNQHLIST